MKKLLTILGAVLFTASVFAQAPQKMSYQAVIHNDSNVLVINTQIGMRISILRDSANGTEVYKEIYNPNPQTNANGLVTVEIGGGIPLTGTFAAIDWSAGPYFIKTETDPTGGTNYTITGTSQLLSVPYAIYADEAGNGFSGSFNDLTNKPTTVAGYGITNAVTTTGNQTIAGDKTFTGNVYLTNKKSKFMFSHFDYNIHWNSTASLSIERYPYYSLIQSDNANAYWVIIPLDMPYKILGNEQLLDSVSFGYKCESAAVSVTHIIVSKQTLDGSASYLYNTAVALTSPTATRHTFNINSTNDSYVGRCLYMLLEITYTGTGASNELFLYEVELTTR
jgi:hypothetical protein